MQSIDHMSITERVLFLKHNKFLCVGRGAKPEYYSKERLYALINDCEEQVANAKMSFAMAKLRKDCHRREDEIPRCRASIVRWEVMRDRYRRMLVDFDSLPQDCTRGGPFHEYVSLPGKGPEW